MAADVHKQLASVGYAILPALTPSETSDASTRLLHLLPRGNCPNDAHYGDAPSKENPTGGNRNGRKSLSSAVCDPVLMNYGLSEGVVQAAALVLGSDPGSVRLHNGPVAVVTHQSEPGSEVVVEGGQFHVDWPQPMPPADDPAAVDEYIDAPHPHSGILHCGTVRSGGGAFMLRPRSHHAVMDALRYAINAGHVVFCRVWQFNAI